MKKLMLVICLGFCMPSAFACKAVSPEMALIMQFDKNKDGQLNLVEWRKSKSQKKFITKLKLGDLKTFAKLDKNKNRKLNAEELTQQIEYIRHPCADWEEQMAKLAQEELAKQPSVYLYEFVVKKEHLSEFEQANADALHNALEPQKGILSVYAFLDKKDEQKRYLLVAYANQNARQTHQSSDEFTLWQKTIEPMIENQKEIESSPFIFGSQYIEIRH